MGQLTLPYAQDRLMPVDLHVSRMNHVALALVLLVGVPACSTIEDGPEQDAAEADTAVDVAVNDVALTPDVSEDPAPDAPPADATLEDTAPDAGDASDASSDDVPTPDAQADAEADTVPSPDTAPACGDGVCDDSEDCARCEADCGACAAVCGDGQCDDGETCTTCDADCGACADNEAPGFIPIDVGTYLMGSPDTEPGRYEQEVVRSVTLTRPLQVALTEVTQEAWFTQMGNNPSFVDACGAGCPVEFVNWYEALAYANALSEAYGFPACYVLEGCDTVPGNGMVCDTVGVTAESGLVLDCDGYRLPTEAEWEYLARGGRGEAWPCGDDSDCVRRIAWYEVNSSGRTHQVNSLQPNAFGLYDTHGNVWEWAWDGYVAELSDEAVVDPTGDDAAPERAIRGGSWINTIRATRSATRVGLPPETRNGHLGFRLVRTDLR